MSQQVTRPTSYAEALRLAEIPQKPNLDPGPAYADDKRQFQGIPGIERAPGGRLWSVCFSGGQGESCLNYVALFTSGDDGASWSGPVLVIDPPGSVRAYDETLWLDPSGRLWLFWTQAHTLHDGRWGVWAITTDAPDAERPQWSAPRRLADGVMLNKPTVLSDGEWLFPISRLSDQCLVNEKRMMPAFLRSYLLALISPEEIEKIRERAGAWVYASTDGGQTLAARGRAQAAPGASSHNEHMVVERSDGSLWMLMRTSYGLGESTSTDRGTTWSPVVASAIPHTSSRFYLRRLRSGNLLLVKHGPMTQPTDAAGNPVKIGRNDLRAFVSDDDGKTWHGGLLIEDRGCSYPDGTEAPDGTLYLTYDRGRRTDKFIMMATFQEADAAAGEPVSGRVRLKTVVNQATAAISDEEDWSHFKGKDDPEQPMVFEGI